MAEPALYARLELRIKDFEKQMAKANRVAGQGLGSIERQSRKSAAIVESRMSRMGARIGTSFAAGLKGAGVALAGAVSARAIASASAAYVDIQNALRVTGLEGNKLERTFDALYDIAQKNGTALGPLVTLYARASQAQKELGATSENFFRFTDSVSLALRVAGTDSQKASGALLQLSQALGSSRVQAEEFNSINEGARPILQAVANGIEEAGGSVSKLKQLVTEGKISNAGFFRGFMAGAAGLQEQAEKAQGTVGQAMERITNAFTKLVGEVDKTSGASKSAATNLSAVADAINALPSAIDAATGKLETLDGWLAKIGNSTAWTKIGQMLGADMSPAGIAASSNALFRGDNSGLLAQQIKAAEARLADFERQASETTNQALVDRYTRAADRARAELVDLNKQLSATATASSPVNTERRGQAGMVNTSGSITPIKASDFKPIGDGDSKKAREDAFQREMRQITERTKMLQTELGLVGQTQLQKDKALATQELENAALRAKIPLTDKINQQIDEAATKWANYAEELRNAEDRQQAITELQREFGSLAIDSIQGLIDGTKSLNDVLADTLKRLAEMALQAAILGDGPLASLFGTKGSGGGVGGLIGKLFGFDGGGYTGDGGKYQPKGIVHGGEFVFSKAAVQKAGAGNLNALHRQLKGYANGGLVGGSARSAPAAKATPPVTIHMHNDFRGVDASSRAYIESRLAVVKADAVKAAVAAVPKVAGSRPGYYGSGR